MGSYDNTEGSFESHSSFRTSIESSSSEEDGGGVDKSVESSLIGSDDSRYAEHVKRV